MQGVILRDRCLRSLLQQVRQRAFLGDELGEPDVALDGRPCERGLPSVDQVVVVRQPRAQIVQRLGRFRNGRH